MEAVNKETKASYQPLNKLDDGEDLSASKNARLLPRLLPQFSSRFESHVESLEIGTGGGSGQLIIATRAGLFAKALRWREPGSVRFTAWKVGPEKDEERDDKKKKKCEKSSETGGLRNEGTHEEEDGDVEQTDTANCQVASTCTQDCSVGIGKLEAKIWTRLAERKLGNVLRGADGKEYRCVTQHRILVHDVTCLSIVVSLPMSSS
ncbi:hypothetical protein BOTCAL_0001g00650 [Botryotinia calthae]|uniref:Uncharacterized protein n=1 Tax=Botryotinia calthae TaxID=38488 RepID=A0A4Y8DKD0_9HELO|nr:hypothetical protein BOTCAL_0001g00650 [Botryotinia calthae]